MYRDETCGAAAVTQLISGGFPTKKILLGIPMFGRSFLGAKGPRQTFIGSGGDDGTFDYNQLPRAGCVEVTDKRRISAQSIGGDGGFVTYDNPQSVRDKAEFCTQKGLGVSTAVLERIVPKSRVY